MLLGKKCVSLLRRMWMDENLMMPPPHVIFIGKCFLRGIFTLAYYLWDTNLPVRWWLCVLILLESDSGRDFTDNTVRLFLYNCFEGSKVKGSGLATVIEPWSVSTCSLSVAPNHLTDTASGNTLERELLRPCPRLSEWETPGMGPSNLF